MQYERGVVALPFRVALGFLLLLFLWSFLGEQFTMINSNPSEYDYEVHSKNLRRHNQTRIKAARGSFLPWRRHVRDRHQHFDPEPLVGRRIELHDLRDRSDLNGAVGRALSFDTYSAHYTVRLSHHRYGVEKAHLNHGGQNRQPRGRKTYRIRPENVRLYKRPSEQDRRSFHSAAAATGNYTRDAAAAAAETAAAAAATADAKAKNGPLHGLFSIEPILGLLALSFAMGYAARRVAAVCNEVANSPSSSPQPPPPPPPPPLQPGSHFNPTMPGGAFSGGAAMMQQQAATAAAFGLGLPQGSFGGALGAAAGMMGLGPGSSHGSSSSEGSSAVAGNRKDSEDDPKATTTVLV